MSDYIGPKQRLIIEALKAGGELWMRYGEWLLYDTTDARSRVNRERCMALYTRGFIMHVESAPSGHGIYKLTEKGKQA